MYFDQSAGVFSCPSALLSVVSVGLVSFLHIDKALGDEKRNSSDLKKKCLKIRSRPGWFWETLILSPPHPKSSISTPYTHIYCLQTKLREDNVFTPVCDSVHGRGVSVQGGLCRGGGGREVSRGISIQGVLTPQYGGRSGATYPTGMHSCFGTFWWSDCVHSVDLIWSSCIT